MNNIAPRGGKRVFSIVVRKLFSKFGWDILWGTESLQCSISVSGVNERFPNYFISARKQILFPTPNFQTRLDRCLAIFHPGGQDNVTALISLLFHPHA